MKRIALVLVLSLFAVHAHATCPTPPSGFYFNSVLWSQDASCYWKSAGISDTTVGCYYGGGWNFAGYDYAFATFSPTAADMYNPAHWWASSFIEFNSASHSEGEYVYLYAYVQHSNNTFDYYPIFYWDGTMGSLSGCVEQSGNFTASEGDTVTLYVLAGNYGNSTIKVSYPRIFNTLN